MALAKTKSAQVTRPKKATTFSVKANMHHSLWLKTLRLQNIATFENQVIHFDPHFNAIIGETGSGKSLIMDALSLVLGQRADKKLIRKNAPFALVEAIFAAPGEGVKKYFNDIGFPYEDEIIIKRIIYPEESSKAYLNLQLCSCQEINNFARQFIDLVGQFDNQKLLSEDYQLLLLDSFAQTMPLRQQYQNTYQAWLQAKQQLTNLQQAVQEQKTREEYLKFQLEQLEELNPTEQDEADLIRQKEILLRQDKAKNVIDQVCGILTDNEAFNVASSLKNCQHLLQQDRTLAENVFGPNLMAQLEDAAANIADVAFELAKKLPHEDDAPQLETILHRLDAYQKLKTKLNANTAELAQRREQFKNELANLSSLADQVQSTTQEIDRLYKLLLKEGSELHAQRTIFAAQLSQQLTKAVRLLRMEGARIDLALQTGEPKASGISLLNFQAETNPGEGFFKVASIASGGELSRILLAFRQVLATTDNISIFFFDEIDSGIGGATATSVGQALHEVAAQTQVLAITHLPQLAQYAQRLLEVHKSTLTLAEGCKTISQVQEIAGDQIPLSLQKMTPLRPTLAASP
ncbi:MAG: AAA family ATPase [Bacteriovoracaceae bacterium]|nr:AAA family ATPase [Bacteriovoracaceae bacterium]